MQSRSQVSRRGPLPDLLAEASARLRDKLNPSGFTGSNLAVPNSVAVGFFLHHHAMLDHALPILALLFTAGMLAPAAAHVFELPKKIGLSRQDYRTVQRLYRGWPLIGVLVVGAFLFTAALVVASGGEHGAADAALAACVCVVLTQVVFWVFTFPVNRKTRNWTVFPDDWRRLRGRWEYSHAVAAALGLAAFMLTILAVLWRHNA